MSERDPDDAGGDDAGSDERAPTEGTDADPESSRAGTRDEGAADVDDVAVETEGDASGPPADVLGGTETDVDPEGVDVADVEPPGELVERVEDADARRVARELSALRRRVEAVESQLEAREEEVADLESRLARKQADFRNYKKRQEERMEAEKRRATEDLVERLLDVRDNLARALEQDEGAEIRGGVESTLRQLDAEFERENVEVIEPEPGDETDPQRHEVLMRVESDRPEGTVADVHRPGYEMAGKVLRAAQVTTSDGAGADDRGPDEEASDEDGESTGPGTDGDGGA